MFCETSNDLLVFVVIVSVAIVVVVTGFVMIVVARFYFAANWRSLGQTALFALCVRVSTARF